MRPNLTDLNRAHDQTSEAPDLLHLLASMLPKDVAFAGGELQHPAPGLFEIEARVIASARGPRRQEFIAGRSYARDALAALGCDACAIPASRDRRPLWPHGYVGSISHSRSLCVAIVARDINYCGLGIDIETDAGLGRDLQRIICRPEERARLGALGSFEEEAAKLVFVAKEAMFKAYYPATNVFLEFSDVLIEFDAPYETFRAKLIPEHAGSLAGLRCFGGRWGRIKSHAVASVTIARAPRC